MTPITREQALEPARYEFQARDGTWHPFVNRKHHLDTEAAGYPIRALYTREQVIADLAREPGVMPPVGIDFEGDESCRASEVREAIVSLQAKLEQSEARVRAKQARIDELMLEYCPDEMSPEQMAEWERRQAPALSKDPGHAV